LIFTLSHQFSNAIAATTAARAIGMIIHRPRRGWGKTGLASSAGGGGLRGGLGRNGGNSSEVSSEGNGEGIRLELRTIRATIMIMPPNATIGGRSKALAIVKNMMTKKSRVERRLRLLSNSIILFVQKEVTAI